MTFFKYIDFLFKVIKANFRQLKHPYKIFLVITKSCGSRCTNCHIWKEVPKNELSLAEYQLLATHMGPHLSWLNLSGGEPTDHENLIEIIDIFIESCPNLLIINFTSNGLNTEALVKVADYLEKTRIPIVGINVSIDGDEDMHQKLRGGYDSYQKAINSLKKIRQFTRLHVHASMTLFQKNAHLVQETFLSIKKCIPDFLYRELHLNYSFFSDHYYKNQSGRNTFSTVKVPSLEKSPAYKLVINPMEFLKRIYHVKLLQYEKEKMSPLPCSSMSSNVYISEHGELYPCTIWNEKIGSLRDNQFNLTELLVSKKALEIKQRIKDRDCPNCWSPCEAFPSILDNIKEAIF